MNWKHKIQIRHYLTDDSSQESQILAAAGIKSEIEKLPKVINEEGLEICEELKEAAEEGDLEWFNNVLNCLWDWLDYESIWVDF